MSSTKPVAPDDGKALLRSVISLALCIHLFCMATVLASNFRRSPLQARLVSIFAPYTNVAWLWYRHATRGSSGAQGVSSYVSTSSGSCSVAKLTTSSGNRDRVCGRA